MKSALLSFALLACTFTVASAQAPKMSLDQLNWLAGGWHASDDKGWTEEWWTPARGGLLLGSNRSGKGDKAQAFEFMRITQDDDGSLTFWGSPGGVPPVPFKLKAAGPDSVTFANATHDFPNTITYAKAADGGVTATIADNEGKNAMSWTWKAMGR